MKLTDIQCTESLRAALRAAFADEPEREEAHERTPPERLRLGQKLEEVLLLEGGAQGRAILEALETLQHRGGPPALVVRGLVGAGEGRDPVFHTIGQAFAARLSLGSDWSYLMQNELHDKASRAPEGFKRAGSNYLHMDPSHWTLITGVEGGANPRHTILRDAEDVINALVEKTTMLLPGQRERLKRDFTELLQMPLWEFHEQGTRWNASQMVIKQLADEAGTLAEKNGTFWAPMLVPNPAYAHAPNGNVCRFQFIPSQFAGLSQRAEKISMSRVPLALRGSAKKMVQAMREVLRPSHNYLQPHGPVLGTGDLLVFDNHLLLHAGGPFVHDRLDAQEARGPARTVRILDLPRDTILPALRPRADDAHADWRTRTREDFDALGPEPEAPTRYS